MATFHFDLVSPEKLVFSGEVDQVDVPGSEGDFGVLADHAPLVAMLRPGILTIVGGNARRFVVRGGFAEVNPQGPDRAGRHRRCRSRRSTATCSPARSRTSRRTWPTRRKATCAIARRSGSKSSRRCRPRWGVDLLYRHYRFANFENSSTTRS